MSKIYKLSEFSGADFIEQIKTAMLALKDDEGSTLIIEPGEYILTSEMARQAQYNVMSGAWTPYPQDIMFCPESAYASEAEVLTALRSSIMLTVQVKQASIFSIAQTYLSSDN